MATLKKHGTVEADYIRFIPQTNQSPIGYIFRQMSDGALLVRPHASGGRWRYFVRTKYVWMLSDISKLSDERLRAHLDTCFN